MKWIVASPLAITATVVAFTPQASIPSWPDVAERVRVSSARLTHPVDQEEAAMALARGLAIVQEEGAMQAVCTAVSIDKGRHYLLTANHCIGADMRVDGQPADLVTADVMADLAVLRAATLKKPALRPAIPGSMRVGMPVSGYGFAYGQLQAQLRTGVVAHEAFVWRGDDKAPLGTWVLTDFPFIGGMSGGAVIDREGRVAGICQQSDGLSGIGRPIATILAITGPYWEPANLPTGPPASAWPTWLAHP